MVLQEIKGFSYATALDLNMGYYTIRLDPDESKICTVIFPWGKYSYKRLPMGIAGSPDIFQEKMLELMESKMLLEEFVHTYQIQWIWIWIQKDTFGGIRTYVPDPTDLEQIRT
jgi:hypothetical protein